MSNKKSTKKPATKIRIFLAHLRVDSQQTIGEMAQALGLHPSYLSSIELGKSPVSDKIFDRIVKEYGLKGAKLKELQEIQSEDAAARAARRRVLHRGFFIARDEKRAELFSTLKAIAPHLPDEEVAKLQRAMNRLKESISDADDEE